MINGSRLSNALKRMVAPAAIVGGIVALFGSGDGASAQVAAKVESQTRPNFGLLLTPPTQARPRHHRRWSYGHHRPGWRPPPVHRPGGEEVVLVDCGGNPGSGAVEAAVHRVRPGGTLILRARGGPCVGWLNIDKPMTIIGEGGFEPRDRDAVFEPTLQAPDGLPCMTVAQNARVEVRDVVFGSPNAGQAACVVSYGGSLVMNRVGFRHTGDEPAIFADGGLVDIRNATIQADTISPAIVTDRATLTAYEVTIRNALSGIEITPGPGDPSTLTRVRMRGVEAGNAFGPRAIGLMVRAGRDFGRVDVNDSLICDYAEGLAVEGASVTLKDSRICRVEKGAVLYNGQMDLDHARVRARDIAVAAVSGVANVRNGVFSGMDWVFVEDRGGQILGGDNTVYDYARGCGLRFEWRYRDRYAPYWSTGNDPRWTCAYDPYPRQWWDQEDGYWGHAYAGSGVRLDGYDLYQQGWGWYDCNNRYVPDRRHFGDDRWRRGGWGSDRACRRPPSGRF